jgi:hypothetical protein
MGVAVLQMTGFPAFFRLIQPYSRTYPFMYESSDSTPQHKMHRPAWVCPQQLTCHPDNLSC